MHMLHPISILLGPLSTPSSTCSVYPLHTQPYKGTHRKQVCHKPEYNSVNMPCTRQFICHYSVTSTSTMTSALKVPLLNKLGLVYSYICSCGVCPYHYKPAIQVCALLYFVFITHGIACTLSQLSVTTIPYVHHTSACLDVAHQKVQT